jgi:hypothetical protein
VAEPIIVSHVAVRQADVQLEDATDHSRPASTRA